MQTLRSQSAYYQPSGALAPVGVVMLLGFGAVVALILGFVYGYLTYYNPFIYISFLATLGFGFAVGWAAWKGGYMGKLRSPLVALFLGALLGVLACYVNWVVWLHALSDAGGEAVWIINPIEIFSVMGMLAEEGVWSLRSWTPTGVFLYIVWGIEAAILIGMPALLTWSGAGEQPFCESCDTWTEAELGLVLPAADNPEQLRLQVETGNLAALRQLSSECPDRFTAVTVHTCPSCHTKAFLTVEELVLTRDKNGETKENRTDIARFLVLNADTLAQARALAERVENGVVDPTVEPQQVPAG